MYKFIKVTADLTVRFDVRKTSTGRPKFWPYTNFLYPFLNMSGETNLRRGSDRVSEVNKFRDGFGRRNENVHKKNYTTCWCKKCKHSNTASHVWWEFNVYTATHVVFDDTEANHTSLRLFYNREESPVVSVDQVSIEYVNIESDICELNCVTCDKHLANKLNKLWENYVDIWQHVRYKYKKSRDVDKLNFIVSHPHGCCKQVSIGHWVNKYEVGKHVHKFTYTTCTCPGSSGAIVHCVGYGDDGWGWWYQLVHSGSINFRLKYSGAGRVW